MAAAGTAAVAASLRHAIAVVAVDECHEQRERERVLAGGEHEHHRGEQIGGERGG